MDKLVVTGQNKLIGDIKVSKAKNATLPILFGVILNPNEVTINELPKLKDIQTTKKLLEMLGVTYTESEEQTTFNASNIITKEATYDLVKTMRASILALGPMLARFGEAKVSLPGGCAIGGRPIDIHLNNLEKMGATITLESGYVKATAEKLIGTDLLLSFPSVGATENLMMAAVYAEGTTTIKNAAKEPEIEDLGDFLNAMGAKVSGHGSGTITIEGVKNLKSANYTPIGDRIEAATYIMTGLMMKNEINVTGFVPQHLDAVIDVLKEMGGEFEVHENGVKVFPSELKSVNVTTAPYPGFPTDAQAQLMALMCVSSGTSVITENIFENRFMHVPELNRLNANIKVEGKSAIIEGDRELSGAEVMCTDLRASAALVMAALKASGKTEISRVYHLDRGYEDIEIKLSKMGADIQRI